MSVSYSPGKQGLPNSRPQYLDNELSSISAQLNQLVNGLTYVQAGAGVPATTPPDVPGRVPLMYDTTGNRLYAYSAGAWHVL